MLFDPATPGICKFQLRPKLGVLGSSPTQLLFSFFLFFPVFLYCHFLLIYTYLIKHNKQQEDYHVSREKIVHRILNIWINNLTFYHLLQFTAGKPELITTCRNDHFPNNVPASSFYRLMVIIAFQHVNRTFNVIFYSFKSRGLTNASINRMFRSITIF